MPIIENASASLIAAPRIKPTLAPKPARAACRKLPAEERSFWKTTVCAWIGFLAQILVLYLCYKYLSSLAAGDVWYVKELGQIGPWGGFEIDITWLGIIGVIIPVAALVYALWLRAADRVKYDRAGRFINEGELA